VVPIFGFLVHFGRREGESDENDENPSEVSATADVVLVETKA
jgi:hypothetical protein